MKWFIGLVLTVFAANASAQNQTFACLFGDDVESVLNGGAPPVRFDVLAGGQLSFQKIPAAGQPEGWTWIKAERFEILPLIEGRVQPWITTYTILVSGVPGQRQGKIMATGTLNRVAVIVDSKIQDCTVRKP